MCLNEKMINLNLNLLIKYYFIIIFIIYKSDLFQELEWKVFLIHWKEKLILIEPET